MATITPESSLDIRAHLGNDFFRELIVYTDNTFASAQNIAGWTITAFASLTDGTFIEELAVTVTNAATGEFKVRFDLTSVTYVVGQHDWQLWINDGSDDISTDLHLLEIRQPVPTS